MESQSKNPCYEKSFSNVALNMTAVLTSTWTTTHTDTHTHTHTHWHPHDTHTQTQRPVSDTETVGKQLILCAGATSKS